MEKSKKTSIANPVNFLNWNIIWPYALILGLVIIFFHDSLFGSKLPYLRDTVCDLFPFRVFAAQAYSHGMIPYWNPSSGFGKPFAADPVTGAYYPLHLLFNILAAPSAYKLSIIVHFFIAGAGAFTLGRTWDLSKGPSLLFSTTFMFNTWMLAWLEFFSAFTVVVWAPLLLLTAHRIVEKLHSSPSEIRIPQKLSRMLPEILIFSLLLAIQYFSGYPEMVLHILILNLAYVTIFCLWQKSPRTLLECIGVFGGIGLLTLAMILVHLIPSIEFLKLSERAASVDPRLESASLHPANLLAVVFPFIYGRPGYPDAFWAQNIYEFCLMTCYIGIIPLFLAPLSFHYFSRRSENPDLLRFVTMFMVAFITIGLLMASGMHTPLYTFVYDHFPLFRLFRWPTKFLVWVMFGSSVLAGIGYQVALTRPRRQMAVLWALACTLFFLLAAVLFFVSTDKTAFFKAATFGAIIATEKNILSSTSDYIMGLFFLGFASASLMAILLTNVPRPILHVVVISITFLNLFLVSRGMIFFGPDTVFNESTKPGLLPTDKSNSTVHSNFATAQQYIYGSRDIEVWRWAKSASVGDSWLPYGVRRVWQGGLKLDSNIRIFQYLNSLPDYERNKLADVLGINLVIAGPPFENILSGTAARELEAVIRSSAKPRLSFASEWEVAPNPDVAIKRLVSPYFDIYGSAVIDGAVASENARKSGFYKKGVFHILSFIEDCNSISIGLENENNGLLILNDTWYPGWTAKVNGVPTVIERVNLIFRGVLVQSGQNRIEFSYTPSIGQKISLWISAITIICAISFLAWLAGRRLVYSAISGRLRN